jgi:hypothetical protein
MTMGQSSKRGRLSPLGAAMAHQQMGRFFQARPETTLRDAGTASKRARMAIADLAKMMGDRAPKTEPMDNGLRAEVYRRQRGGLAPTLTARQRRRLRKNANRGQILAYQVVR